MAVGTLRRISATDLSAVWTVVDELPQVDHRIVIAMKSTVPVGPRPCATGSTIADFRTSATSRTRSSRRRGTAATTSCTRPDRGRRVRSGGWRRRRTAPRRYRRAGGAVRRVVGGDDQARRQCGTCDADLVHQRDRERLRGDGRRRGDGCAGHRVRPTASGPRSRARASASAGPVFRRTRSRSSSLRRTRATTSSSSTRSSR